MLKKLLNKSNLLMLALLVGGSLYASAETKTASFAPSNFSGQGTSGSGSAISATVDGVTFACDKGYGTTQVRCYGGSKITISSAKTITAISFTFSGAYDGGLNTSYTGLSTTSWEQTLSKQARITAATVTYEETDSRAEVATILDDLTPVSIVNGDEGEFTVTISYASGATGSVTWESDNEEILLVDDGEYIAMSEGKANVTVTVTPTDATTYKTVSKTFNVTVTKATHVKAYNEVFYESFDGCDGTGGNDGQWNGSIASKDLNENALDNDVWEFTTVNAAMECVKLASSKNSGSASATLQLTSGQYTLKFKAGAWNKEGEGTMLNISATNALLDKSEVTLALGSFTEYTAILTVAENDNVEITFATSAGGNRFFLDEVQLLAVTQTKEVTSHGWSTYITKFGSTFAAGTAYAVTAVGADNQTITISEVTEAKAGTPLLLKGADQTITATVAETSVEPTNLLTVCDGTITSGMFPYVLAQDGDGAGFKEWTGDLNTLKDRVVLSLSFQQPDGARMMRIVEGGATGISTVENVLLNSNNCFDLQGRRVAQPQKGLYIVNGKKMVIK